jgi:hypothetical protein
MSGKNKGRKKECNMAKKKRKVTGKEYLVVVDNSGEDSETEILRMTKEEISKLSYKDCVAVIDGSIIKSFSSKFDIGKLK